MNYNQKTWLGVLVICTLFWLGVAGSINYFSKTIEKPSKDQKVKNTPARTAISKVDDV
ncbi:hypothetical protein ACQ86O_14905 [Serratia sp. L9]|uniref:hypothetical protein n=1 Tax=Serratia sp. L9 TaxID=3423946 RepID=UPI003D6753A8